MDRCENSRIEKNVITEIKNSIANWTKSKRDLVYQEGERSVKNIFCEHEEQKELEITKDHLKKHKSL